MSSRDTVALIQTSETSATLTLTNPDRRNAIGPDTAADIAWAMEAIIDWGVTTVRLEAEGPAFCAGADLADLDASARAVDVVVDLLTTTPVYFLAVVRGHVRGAGLALLAACPRVLAGAEATFGLPEIGRGFFPTALIDGQARRIGARNAFALAFSGQPVSAGEAERIGLVSRAVDTDDLDAVVDAELRVIGAAVPDAIREGVGAWQGYARAAAVTQPSAALV